MEELSGQYHQSVAFGLYLPVAFLIGRIHIWSFGARAFQFQTDLHGAYFCPLLRRAIQVGGCHILKMGLCTGGISRDSQQQMKSKILHIADDGLRRACDACAHEVAVAQEEGAGDGI